MRPPGSSARVAAALTLAFAMGVSLVSLFTKLIPFNDAVLMSLTGILAGTLIALFWHTANDEGLSDLSTGINILSTDMKDLTLSVGQIRFIEDTEEYYSRLESAIDSARKTVDLMYLTPTPPSVGTNAVRAERYWRHFVETAKKPNRSVRYRRIASVDGAAKRDWLVTSTQMLAELPNYGLRCYLPNAPNTLPLVAVEIVDGKEAFLFGPHFHDGRLHVRNTEFATAISRYFEEAWKRIGTDLELKQLEQTVICAGVEARLAALNF